MVSGAYLQKNLLRCETKEEYGCNYLCLLLFPVNFKACDEEMCLICFYV